VGILLAAVFVAATPTQAGPRDDVVGVLVKCADIADKAERLDCYDRAAPQLRAAAQQPMAPVVAPPATAQAAAPSPPQTAAAEALPPQAPAAQQDDSFLGAINPFSGGPQGPSAQQMAYQPIGGEILPVTIGVAEYSIAPNGSFSVTLDNGQVWRERNEHFDHPQFRSDEKNVVVIERGMIGGYNLYLKGEGKPYKVLREK
jgi:hypothetical protein